MKRLACAISACLCMSAQAEMMRVTAFTFEGELAFIGIFDVTFKPKLKYGAPYACHMTNGFTPSLSCTIDAKGAKKVGRYCLKEKKGSDLMCSRSIFVGE